MLKLLRKKPFITEIRRGRYSSYDYNLTLSLVDEKGREVTSPTHCKSYLVDAINAAVNSENLAYVCYNKETPPGLDKTRVCLYLQEQHHLRTLKKESKDNVLRFLHVLEAKLGLEPSTVEFGTNKESAKATGWVFLSDKRWLLSAPAFSFYLMCVRLGPSYDGQDIDSFLSTNSGVNTRDWSYCRDSSMFWKKLLAQPLEETFGDDIKANYPPGFVTHVHGYLWFSRLKEIPRQVSHWKDLTK